MKTIINHPVNERGLDEAFGKTTLPKALLPAERPILDSLFTFTNQGSHAVFEDLYYAPTVRAEQMHLEVFRKICQAHDQEGHYNMVMATKDKPTS